MTSTRATLIALCLVSLSVAAVADTTTVVAAESTADKLMSRVHNARAVWERFPGFTAEMMISHDGMQQTATVSVNRKFKIEVSPKKADSEWLQRKLTSVIGHRRPTPRRNYEVSFAAEEGQHPLGRLLVSADGNNRFRIQNDVLTEVFRRSDSSEFSITLLDVVRTSNSQYLPSISFVTRRDPHTGDLLSETHNSFTWTRVGDFDLPEKLVTVNTGDQRERDVWQVEFRNHRLNVSNHAETAGTTGGGP